MSHLDFAVELASLGFHVFPLTPHKKAPPLIMDFPEKASKDPQSVSMWWSEFPEANIGISTSKFGDGEALLVVDIDNKGDKRGSDEILKLELEGFELPETFEQITPTGGRHLVYRVSQPVRQGVNRLGRGVDIRSRGGYIVGYGSSTRDGSYTAAQRPLAVAPEWLVSRCGQSVPAERRGRSVELDHIDEISAAERAVSFLARAPLAIEGAGGNATTYQVAARVKDYGISEKICYELLSIHWNPRCSPPWSEEDLKIKVRDAYRYGLNPPGIDAPENVFAPVIPEEGVPPSLIGEALSPVETLNREYAFVIAGGGDHILWETKDHRGLPKLEHLNTQSFHKKLASQFLVQGDGKAKQLSALWMTSPNRRSFDGLCFMPGKESPPRFYNLWKGFAYDPLPPQEKPSKDSEKSLKDFLDHARENVCRGDGSLYGWLIGYFAHLVQRPWEKPLVALVFRGSKGTGKNALVERVGSLLGNHFILTADKRYLVGNFNGHLENCLFIALDEAFWSGDKQAEGTLKNLITGSSHVIEHKGKEPYAVENCTRVAIIGNEEWLVPATQDERRFAVFDVGDGRKQDRAFFQGMREGMERGGYRLLLRYLLDFNLDGIDVNDAPRTQALLDQKVNTLEPFPAWWLDCLHNGRITYSDFGGEWERVVDKDRFRSAFRRYAKERNISSRLPDDRMLGKLLCKFCKSIDAAHKRREGSAYVSVYKLPTLETARKEWEAYIGHPIVWDVDNNAVS